MKVVLSFKNISLKILAFIIVMMPLFNYYDFPGTTTSLVTILLIIELAILVYCNVKYDAKLYMEEWRILLPYIMITVYIVIITLVASIFGENSGKLYILLALILNTMNIYYFVKVNNCKEEFSNYVIKTYIVICLILCAITIGEEVIYFFTGFVRPMKFDFLPLTSEMERLGYRFGYNGRGSFIGFSPFFSEPSHMAQYLLPAIVIQLERIKREPVKAWMLMGIIETSIVISTSTLGIVISFLMMIFYICLGKTETAKKYRNIVFLCLPLLMGIFVFFIRARLFYDANMANAFSYTSEKTTYRLYRGFIYYSQFPIVSLIFGIGFNNLTSFIDSHGLSYSYEIYSEDVVSEYLNGISQSLVYGGIIAFILLVLLFVRLYKYGNIEHKTLVLALALLMLTAATFLRGMSVFYIFIIFALHVKMINADELVDK